MNIPTPRNRSTILTVILILAAVVLNGCSDETTSPSSQALTAGDNYEALDFTQPNGGLTVSDEDIAFGDKALADILYNEDCDQSDDPMLSDPEVMTLDAMAEDPADSNDLARPRFTFVRLEWGMIHGPGDSLITGGDCGTLDWTGDISVDRGLLVVSSLIRFEFPRDHLVRPRPDRQTVGFVSHTGCNFDGLVLKIIERAEDMDPGLTTNMLHINTGPYTADFALRDLIGMNESFPVDELGNSLHLLGFTMEDIVRCPKGFINGRWRLLPSDAPLDSLPPRDSNLSEQYGTFAGPWIDLAGHIRGFMRCGYGLDENGNQVFSGKRINRLGRFTAFVEGTWVAAEDGISLLGFDGQWITAAGTREGVLGARAFPSPLLEVPGGYYEGRWATLCDPEAEDQVH